MSGVLGGKFSRKTTQASDWENARRVAEAYELADSWTGKPEVKPAPPEEEAREEKPTVARATIVEACRVYIAHQESAGLKPSTRVAWSRLNRVRWCWAARWAWSLRA